MARSFPLEEGGSATGVLITDRCHGPGGDGGGLLLFPFEEQSNNEQMDQIKASNVAGFALFAARDLEPRFICSSCGKRGADLFA
jgi:hypothetical protein